MEVLQNI